MLGVLYDQNGREIAREADMIKKGWRVISPLEPLMRIELFDVGRRCMLSIRNAIQHREATTNQRFFVQIKDPNKHVVVYRTFDAIGGRTHGG